MPRWGRTPGHVRPMTASFGPERYRWTSPTRRCQEKLGVVRVRCHYMCHSGVFVVRRRPTRGESASPNRARLHHPRGVSRAGLGSQIKAHKDQGFPMERGHESCTTALIRHLGPALLPLLYRGPSRITTAWRRRQIGQAMHGGKSPAGLMLTLGIGMSPVSSSPRISAPSEIPCAAPRAVW